MTGFQQIRGANKTASSSSLRQRSGQAFRKALLGMALLGTVSGTLTQGPVDGAASIASAYHQQTKQAHVGEDWNGMVGSTTKGFHPMRLFYYAKKIRKSNQKYADTGIWGWDDFHPISGKIQLASGEASSVFVSANPLSQSQMGELGLEPVGMGSARTPTEARIQLQKIWLAVLERNGGSPRSDHSKNESRGWIDFQAVSVSHGTEAEAEHAGGCWLAHLANGQADAWFYLRLRADRHEDDVDREAEGHAMAEEARLVDHEIAGSLHAAEWHDFGMHPAWIHLQHLHHIDDWWLGWQGHSEGGSRATEEAVDGQDHDIHDSTFGRHVAEWYWRMMHEWGLTTGDIEAHDHIRHFGLFLHAGEYLGAAGHGGSGSLHEEADERGRHMPGHTIEVEELDDFNGFRHGWNGNAHAWWMYLLQRAEQHAREEHAKAGHAVMEGSHRPMDVAIGNGSFHIDPAREWREIILGRSAYEPGAAALTPRMAGHEIPPEPEA